MPLHRQLWLVAYHCRNGVPWLSAGQMPQVVAASTCVLIDHPVNVVADWSCRSVRAAPPPGLNACPVASVAHAESLTVTG
jgi:hypothetical protein